MHIAQAFKAVATTMRLRQRFQSIDVTDDEIVRPWDAKYVFNTCLSRLIFALRLIIGFTSMCKNFYVEKLESMYCLQQIVCLWLQMGYSCLGGDWGRYLKRVFL